MKITSRASALAAVAALALAAGLPAATSAHSSHQRSDHATGQGSNNTQGRKSQIKHVLLISVDGLHQSDVQWYAHQYPNSALARLTRRSTDYRQAMTPVPSDSFPGMVGQVTGGDPGTTGVYYDAEYNHNVFPAGTTSCTGTPPGGAVFYAEPIVKDPSRLDSSQGLPNLPGDILQLTGQPRSLIDPSTLPVDPTTCTPIYPNQYLKVNTVFNVLHDAGLRTAWSDKHVAYDILSGPSGTGIDDLFAPEINSNAIGYPAGDDWTADNLATQQYDSYKVQAILNEIDGKDHSGSTQVGVPALFGMNFQTVSTAQKLPTSDGLAGGYLPGTATPGPLLTKALTYISDQLGAMQSELAKQGLARSTAIIVSAKHGQSPIDPNTLTRIDDGAVLAGLNAAWTAAHPGAGDLVAASTDDDAMLLWLSDRSQAAADFAKQYLLSHSATGNTASGGSRTLQSSGLAQVYAGADSAQYFHVPVSDPRHPDLFGIVQHGVVYTGGTKKIAEHGGADPQDRHVALLLYAPGVPSGRSGAGQPVETTQIAPTILRLLGFDPSALQAVQAEGTPVLPGVGH